MNNKVLISTAMLNAYWEKEKKDTLDLLFPFIKYSIAKTTDVGGVVDIYKMSSYFKSEFGYETMPTNVIILILNRMSPSILIKNNGNFILKSSLDDDVRKFEKGHAQFEEQCSKVGFALKEFLNKNLTFRSSFDEESALQALITFFATNGLCIIRDTVLLDILKKKDDALKYNIAQFILKEREARSELFSYIEDFVKGFFVSTAISLQPQNPTMSQSKFKGLKCYIDTRVIIDALGLRLSEAKEAALELLGMLKHKGAELYCFKHNYREICDIIGAYKNGLRNPYHSHPYQTLESWDAQKYTITDVERYLTLLSNKIANLGIEIVSKPQIDDVTKYPFSDCDLEAFIKEHMTYNNPEALRTDIDSVASILLLKDGNKAAEIEKSGAIFVTSNVHLVSVVNSFLKEKGICDPYNEAPPMITDINLSSIVWLKCYSTHKDYPTQRLIEYAITALEPTPTMLKTFFDIVDRIQSEGGITEDEASIIRSDAFCRKELSLAIKGNVESISDATVYDIKDKLRKLYVGDADNKGELNYKKYLEEKRQKRKSILGALEQIDKHREKKYNSVYQILNVTSWVIWVLIIVTFILFSVISINESKYIFGSIVLLIFSIIGTVDMLYTKWNFVKHLIQYVAKNISDDFADKKKEEYEIFLGSISYDMPE